MNSFFYGLPVLVTGGAGFIGSHITDQLVASGAHVTVIDNLSTGAIENLSAVKQNIQFIQTDISNYQSCLDASKNKKVIFHLAAFISVPQSIENPELCYKTNVLGTLNMLQAAVANNVEYIVFSSSSAVYGSCNEVCTEETPGRPESPYGHSKLLGEQLCSYFTNQFGLTTIILRYFNVYGQRQNPNGTYAAAVAKFSSLMQANKPITIFGDGLQTRDFIPVDHVVKANLQTVIHATKNQSQIYNIGTGKSITLLTLIDILKQQFPNYHEPITFLPARSGDVKYSQANCSKYQQLQ